MDFVVTVSKMNYLNLNKLQPFADNPNFNGTGIDFLQIALEMKKTLALATNQFTRVITEVYDLIKIFNDEIINSLF